MSSVILVTSRNKWKDKFHKKLVFSTLTDEHILRLLMLQKIKISRNLSDTIKIYIDDIILDDMSIHKKLLNILKYKASDFNITIIDINNEIDEEEINLYNQKVQLKYLK